MGAPVDRLVNGIDWMGGIDVLFLYTCTHHPPGSSILKEWGRIKEACRMERFEGENRIMGS